MHSDAFNNPSVSNLPCAGGLIAGTLALMTCWAVPDNDTRASEDQRRLLMARKILSNLCILRQHPDVAPGLRLVIGKVHERWRVLVAAVPAGAAIEAAPSAPVAVGNAVH